MEEPPHAWAGDLTVAGGRVYDYRPCWIAAGQGVPRFSGKSAAFEMVSTTQHLTDPSQNANVFEFEADPSASVRVRMNGLEEIGSVAELAACSREMWFKDECVEMLRERAGIEPLAPERMDIYHHVAHKVKLHRVVPEAGYTAGFEIEDDERLTGEVNYRIRVEQRNGQRAWSSPIWVGPSEV
jgi:hypothetical protein